jgi:zinc/manganese transport system substrate-binding protein
MAAGRPRGSHPASKDTGGAVCPHQIRLNLVILGTPMAAALRPLALLAALALALSACDRSGPAPVGSASISAGGSHPRFIVVAAENFWGSLAAQLAGDRALVSSIVSDPEADPHSYQPNAQDARMIAGANMVIVNGVGYDEWARQLVRASPSSERVVLDVGSRLSLAAGSNPHRWYFPGDVAAVIDAIVADYDRLDPADAPYFARRMAQLQHIGLARYGQLRAQIRARYAGVPVGYSESLFQGLGEDLGLRLLTPYSFTKAIAEGTDVTARDKEAVDSQVREHRIRVWVFNSQNVTPDVQRVDELARRAHIPIATLTETLAPVGDTFEQWQVAQLEGLERALHAATGR